MLSWPSFEALARGWSFLLLEQSINPTPWTTSNISSHTLGPYTPALVAPGPGTRQPGTAPMPQGLLTLLTLANPKRACPFFPSESAVKALAHCSPLSLCLVAYPSSSLSVPARCAVFSPGNCESNKLQNPFWLLSIDLFWPHHTSPKVIWWKIREGEKEGEREEGRRKKGREGGRKEGF